MAVVRSVLILALLGLAVSRPATISASPTAAPFVVNWSLDEPDATPLDGVCFSTPSGKCTLRAAVQQANANAGPDTILLGSGFYVLNRVGDEDAALSGDLDILDDLTIRGAGMNATTIVLDHATVFDRVLHIVAGVVRLEALGLTGGKTQYAGGGIYNSGKLTLDHTRVFSNSTVHLGGGPAGGILNANQITVTQSLIDYNEARTTGGGLVNTGSAWIDNTTLAHNQARDSSGGGFLNNGVMSLANSTVSANASLYSVGGGISNVDNLTLANVTVSGNRSADGGSGLHTGSSSATYAYNLTLTANVANTDADASTDDSGLTQGGGVYLWNSIVARNYDLSLGLPYYDDCDGTLNIYGNDYLSPLGQAPFNPVVAPCTFSLGVGGAVFVNILGGQLGPLADNGGPTQTHDLMPASPAYDGGDATVGCLGPTGLLVTDQRGVPRVAGVRCDAGAVEHGSLWRLYTPIVTR